MIVAMGHIRPPLGRVWPVRTLGLAGAAFVALLLGACGGGASGLEGLALTLDDLPSGATVAREQHVRVAGALGAFERVFEPAGEARDLALGDSSLLSIELIVVEHEGELRVAGWNIQLLDE